MSSDWVHRFRSEDTQDRPAFAEMEVLALIGQGLSNGEIADRLVIALSTVKTHISNIYGKLGVQAVTRAQNLDLW